MNGLALNDRILECLISPSFEGGSLKKTINSELNEELVENIKVEDAQAGQFITIYFEGGNRYHYLKKRMSGCRNDVNLLVTKLPSEHFTNMILKSYDNSKNCENEEFLLRLFDGRFGMPKLASTKQFGKFKVTQMEDKGRNFKDVLHDEYGWGALEEEQKKECFEQAIGLYQQMFEFLRENSDYISKNAPIQRKIDAEYCMQRFNPFIVDLKNIGYENLAQRLDENKNHFGEIIASNAQHWIHGDYAPRNLVCNFRKEQIISAIDFETAAKGSPVQDMTSLLYNPENKFSEATQRDLEKSAVRMLCGIGVGMKQISQLWQPCRAFWNVRQAKWISPDIIGKTAKEKDIKEFEWYVNDIDNALNSIEQNGVGKFYSKNYKIAAGL
ncbi:MAG: phosphotransferase [Nanoarchaeota archaeon]|nr:phosphotransferase [Nanoarchaeota archaeon]